VYIWVLQAAFPVPLERLKAEENRAGHQENEGRENFTEGNEGGTTKEDPQIQKRLFYRSCSLSCK
jgi:hypothetical protein